MTSTTMTDPAQAPPPADRLRDDIARALEVGGIAVEGITVSGLRTFVAVHFGYLKVLRISDEDWCLQEATRAIPVTPDHERIVSLVRSCLAPEPWKRELAVRLGLPADTDALLAEVIRRNWHANLDIETGTTWCIAQIWDTDLHEPPWGYGATTPVEALAMALLEATAQEDDRDA